MVMVKRIVKDTDEGSLKLSLDPNERAKLGSSDELQGRQAVPYGTPSTSAVTSRGNATDLQQT